MKNLDNLLSGFLGAVAAVFLSEIWRLINLNRDRRKRRKILKDYLINIIRNGLVKYLIDIDKAINLLERFPYLNEATLKSEIFDHIPSLNSDTFREIGFNELYFISKSSLFHSKFIDLYHCIDFIKLYGAYAGHSEFISYCVAHFKEKKVKSREEMIKHIEDGCVSIRNKRDKIISNLKLRKNTATESLRLTNELIEKL